MTDNAEPTRTLAQRLVDEAQIEVAGVIGEVSTARAYAVAATVAVLRELVAYTAPGVKISAFDPAGLAEIADEIERTES